MKRLTHTGRGILRVPGICVLAQGKSELVSDAVASALDRVKPPLPIVISDDPDRSQPEAQQGEGQPIANEQEE